MVSNRGPSAYQPNALLRGQTGSPGQEEAVLGFNIAATTQWHWGGGGGGSEGMGGGGILDFNIRSAALGLSGRRGGGKRGGGERERGERGGCGGD